MSTLRIFAVSVWATAAIASCPAPSGAQSASAANKPVSVSIRISLQKSTYAIGEKPIAVMTIENISSSGVCFSTASYLYRIHVASRDGEAPKTEFHRHLLGDFRPGDGPVLEGGPVDCRPIAPGSLDSLKYDLTAYYDLSTPGEYSVFLEIYDPAGPRDGSGHWLRTNTVTFEIQPPAQ